MRSCAVDVSSCLPAFFKKSHEKYAQTTPEKKKQDKKVGAQVLGADPSDLSRYGTAPLSTLGGSSTPNMRSNCGAQRTRNR